MEVMGRSAGWIAPQCCCRGGGAEVCLIPEIPYDINKVVDRIMARYQQRRGFANIIIAEGAKAKGGDILAQKSDEKGYQNVRLGELAINFKSRSKPQAACLPSRDSFGSLHAEGDSNSL